MPHDDVTTLRDIADAARLTRRFIADVTPENFLSDDLRKSAVIHQILVIGEAVKRLSPDLRAAHPGIPWADMAGFRDKLIHAYDMVDLDIVVEAAYHELPALLAQIEPLVPRKEP
jgi:uncharacterized protein with HEPN domain